MRVHLSTLKKTFNTAAHAILLKNMVTHGFKMVCFFQTEEAVCNEQ